jgi:predicted metalloprotease
VYQARAGGPLHCETGILGSGGVILAIGRGETDPALRSPLVLMANKIRMARENREGMALEVEVTTRRRPWRWTTAAAAATVMILGLAACGSSAAVNSNNDGQLGGNSGSVNNGSPADNGSTSDNGACQPPSLAHCYTEATMQDYLSKIVPMVESFYAATWAHPLMPNQVVFIADGQTVQTGCQDQSGNTTQDASFYDYCASDNNIYLGQSELWSLYSEAGDVAPAIGLAHEMGHEQQTNFGIPSPQDNAQTLIHEDQADCLSGVWFAYEISQGNIQAEDFPSTAKYLDMIASAENDPNRDHGDLQERLNSFIIGKNSGPSGCNQFYPNTPIITSS